MKSFELTVAENARSVVVLYLHYSKREKVARDYSCVMFVCIFTEVQLIS